MQALPVGVPKLLVSTMASGDTRPYVGTSDVTLMYPVTDVAGLNRVSRRVLGNAAGAMAGMVRSAAMAAVDEPPLGALTMFGVTTAGVMRVQERLEGAGFETIVFHAVGTGGQAMEQMVEDRFELEQERSRIGGIQPKEIQHRGQLLQSVQHTGRRNRVEVVELLDVRRVDDERLRVQHIRPGRRQGRRVGKQCGA